jgi:hypothetical protein
MQVSTGAGFFSVCNFFRICLFCLAKNELSRCLLEDVRSYDIGQLPLTGTYIRVFAVLDGGLYIGNVPEVLLQREVGVGNCPLILF